MMEDGTVRSADLSYTTRLEPRDGDLPAFTVIEIGQNAEGTTDSFRDAYPENRLRSLMHRWLAMVEDASRDAEPARELLAPDFALNFSSGPVTDFDAFRAWLTGPAAQVAASSHRPEAFRVETLDTARYRLFVDFDWQGILPDDTRLEARTRHVWTVSDDPTERFARIQRMDVETLVPFRPATT